MRIVEIRVRLSKWKVKSGMTPKGDMVQIRRQLKKINDERFQLIQKQKNTEKVLSNLNNKLKVLFAKQHSYQLEIGKRKSARCPCFKTRIKKSTYFWQSDKTQLICLARKNTWEYNLMMNDFLRIYCGQCTKNSTFKVNKALLRHLEGEWKNVPES